MNKIILAPIFVIALLMIPASALAMSDQQRYMVGWYDGVAMKYGAYPDCNSTHTDSYCNGYAAGYASQSSGNGNFQPNTSQQSSVNIKGDNNRVTVNQQTNNQFGSNSGSGSDGHHHHHSSGGQLPNCQFLCLGVNVQ